jgi:hypothetical protein
MESLSKLERIRDCQKASLTHFVGSQPTLSHRVAENIPIIIRQNIAIVDEDVKKAFKLAEKIDPVFAKCARAKWEVVKDFKMDRKDIRNCLHAYGEHLEQKLLDALKDAQAYTVYVDESRNRRGATKLALCITYVDRDGAFHSELLKTFDVSENKSGKAMYDTVSEYLQGNGVHGFVVHICTDGASSMRFVAGGKDKSFVANFMLADNGAANGLWCMAHRWALVFGDALLKLYGLQVPGDNEEEEVEDGVRVDKKSAKISRLPIVQLLRKLHTFMKSSTSRYPKLYDQLKTIPLEDAMDVVGKNGVFLKLLAYCPSRWTSFTSACTRMHQLIPAMVPTLQEMIKPCSKPSRHLITQVNEILDLIHQERGTIALMRDFSSHYNPFMCKLQVTNRPIIDTCFITHLEFQAKLYTVCMQPKEGRDNHDEKADNLMCVCVER